MNPVDNPFAPGAGTPPPELAGRDELREIVRVALERVRRGLPTKSVLMVGLRGVGKTVLLDRMRDDAEAAGLQTIRIEAPESRSLPALLAPQLRQALLRAGVDIAKVEFVIASRDGEGADSRLAVGPSSIDRIRRNDVDAANVDMPFDLQAQKRGLNAIELPALPVIHNTTICANMDFVSENEETTVTFLKALIEAVHFFKTEKDKSCAIIAREVAPLIGLDGDEAPEKAVFRELHEETSMTSVSLIRPAPRWAARPPMRETSTAMVSMT